VRIAARAPGKLVVLGEYAVLDGVPALVLAVDRYVDAAIEPSRDERCHLETRAPEPALHRFAAGRPSGVPLVDLVTGQAAVPPWRGVLDSSALFEDGTKLGLGSSAAALCAWAGVWARYAERHGAAVLPTTLAALIDAHRTFQSGTGSGLDVAASLAGGLIEFRLDPPGVPRVGSVRLPNSVGFAGIFAGRSASTPELVGRYRAWRAARPREADAVLRGLRSIAEAGCAAARGDDAAAFVAAIADYGRGLQNLGVAIGAEIVTAEHGQIGEHAQRFGVAYKVSGAGGGDLGLALAADLEALAAFKRSVTRRGFRVIDFCMAERGLVVEEHAE
jgi:phosphomevalonate kinase